ncbi:DNA repair protein RecN [Draconibacterium sp. IB214405]|uniref:DNA repair protein RecN n=1 Tax=Draconibacterium sp. IB214405 TaxID=3097352 RepID=UPI002A0E4A57|nr:DNA repair protein RecN [Draconibacterium sp. IB214405]MDX8339920.1 DNA repair protein RecN [Draconibacterium sp. IB214405]
MLSRLSISNYALISKLQVNFHANLNTLTGETGAGKSIILGALGLIMGNRADLSVLKDKDTKCIVEGQFEVSNYPLKWFFEENDLDYDTSTILRREITPSGKSRAFINDTPVNLKVLRAMGLQLIDIHSQHQNLELSNQKFQLHLVDSVARSEKLLAAYKSSFSLYKKAQKELIDLEEKAEKSKADLDYFQFQFTQLEEAQLNETEQEDLESELEQLTHAEDIKMALTETSSLLDNETFSVLQNVKDSHRTLGKIAGYLKETESFVGRLESAAIELSDIHQELDQLSERVEFNPGRIEEVNDRLNLLYSLQQKHHVATVKELIQLRDEFDMKINEAVGFDDEILAKKAELEKQRENLEALAQKLSMARKKVFKQIEDSVISDLQQLGMTKAKLHVVHNYTDEFQVDGKDEISFLFSANHDSAPDEISKIASGGEMSRLMLAIKNLLRNSKALPTIVFDEIDTGVSGEIALKMGTIIKSFSVNTQIINITHLPQIAAKGDAHFRVYKLEENGKTFTSIKALNEEERIEELAKMVGGDKLTETTIRAAEELLRI